MRTIISIVKAVAVTILLAGKIIAQDSVPLIKSLPPTLISVALDKTSNLIFPERVVGVDRGSSSIVAQIANGSGNIVQVKASIEYFSTTNLSVITADGSFYSFMLAYDPNPVTLNLKITGSRDSGKLIDVNDNQEFYSKDTLNQISKEVLISSGFTRKSVSNQDVRFTLRGIYLSPGLSWFFLHAKNESLVPFKIESISIAVQDKKSRKREALQEKILPVIFSSPLDQLNGHDSTAIAVAVKQITIPASKFLRLKFIENNGGRSMEMKVRAKTLSAARPIQLP